MAEMQAPVTPSSGSIRTRRYRERMKSGKIYVRFEMTPEGVDRLVEQGWLASDMRDDWRAVTQAFLKLGTLALWPSERDPSHNTRRKIR